MPYEHEKNYIAEITRLRNENTLLHRQVADVGWDNRCLMQEVEVLEREVEKLENELNYDALLEEMIEI